MQQTALLNFFAWMTIPFGIFAIGVIYLIVKYEVQKYKNQKNR